MRRIIMALMLAVLSLRLEEYVACAPQDGIRRALAERETATDKSKPPPSAKKDRS
jgi:hypothetical protein